MKAAINAAARHPVLANLLMVVLLAAGFMSAQRLPREVFPEFSLDRILVTVPYPGASPEETEEAICLKIEEAIEGVDGIKKVESTASENVGTVVVELLPSVRDVSKVKDDIKSRIDQITTFPDDAEEPRIEELLLKRHVINVALYGDAPEATLREMARRMKDELLALDGISQVSFLGVRDYQISIEIPEVELRRYGLTLDQVARCVARNCVNVPGGTVRAADQQIKIETKGRRYRGLDFEKIVLVTRPDGTQLTIGDIGRVVDAFEEDDRYGRFDGKPAVLLVVHKTGDEDAIQISSLVRNYVREERKRLPDGLHVTTWTDTSTYIEDRIDLLLRNGRVGIVLVFAALWFFLCLRLSFWVSLGIPVSFAAALCGLWLTGGSLNMLSLFGFIMALGLVVDDAIVIGENVHRHQQAGDSLVDGAVVGTTEMALPVLGAVSTTVVAFVPLMFVSGIMGKFIAVLPVAVIGTLIGSTIESLFILPAHLAHQSKLPWAPGFITHTAERMRGWLDRLVDGVIYRVYFPLYSLALSAKTTTVCVAVLVLLLCLGMVQGGLVEINLFPRTDSEIIISRLSFAEGTPVVRTDAAIRRLERAAMALNSHFAAAGHTKVVKNVYAQVGEWSEAAGPAGQGPHLGEVWLELTRADARDVHSQEILNTWRKLTGRIPETTSHTFTALRGGPGGKAIELRIKGYDLKVLRAAAQDARNELAKFGGLEDLEDDYRAGKPELTVTLKPTARPLGVTLMDLGRQLRAGYYGEEALRIQRGRDEVKVYVRYPREERRRLADLETIRIRNQAGQEFPIREVADFKITRKPAHIQREQGRRRINVYADVAPAANAREIIAAFSKEALPKLRARYPTVRFDFEGQKQESRESVQSLMAGLVVALLVIYAILAVIFGSYVQPVIIMFTIPFGMIGAVLGHWIRGLDLTMLSLFGLVALTGVVVNDSLVLIHRINAHVTRGLSVYDAVRRAGPERFRAIILTSLTTVAGLMPIITERSFQAQYVIPMAVSLAFGLAFATLVTLFVVPCLYMELNAARRVARWLVRGYWPTMGEVEPHTMLSHEAEPVRSLPPPTQALPDPHKQIAHEPDADGKAAAP